MSLFDVFVIVFRPLRCTTTIDVELLFKQLTNRNVAIACDQKKTKDVHGQVQFNINCNSFVIAFEVCRVS